MSLCRSRREEYVRACVLHCLPSDYIAEGVEAPTLQARQMHVRRAVIEVEGASNKGLLSTLSSFPKTFQCLRLCADRSLVCARQIDTAEEDGTTGVVDKLSVRSVYEVCRNLLARGGRHRRNARHDDEK